MFSNDRGHELPAEVSQDLTVAKRKLKTHLSLADRAVRAAMAEADRIVVYRGPERRSRPR